MACCTLTLASRRLQKAMQAPRRFSLSQKIMGEGEKERSHQTRYTNVSRSGRGSEEHAFYTPPAWATILSSERIPPVYTVAAAILAGDALGNCHLSAPIWLAVLIAIAAALSFLARRPHWGTALALLALGAAAGTSVHDVLDPPPDTIGIRRFGDGAQLAIEGRLVREPERYRDRLHLYLKVERGSRPGQPLAPASG